MVGGIDHSYSGASAEFIKKILCVCSLAPLDAPAHGTRLSTSPAVNYETD